MSPPTYTRRRIRNRCSTCARRGARKLARRSRRSRLEPAAQQAAIYEAGGGSTSFLPLDVLRRAHVTVVDIDEEQIRNNDYAQKTILATSRPTVRARQFRSRICYKR